MKKALIILAVVIVALAGIWYFALRDTDTDNSDTVNTEQTDTTNTPSDETPAADEGDEQAETAPESVTITYTNNGFSPRSYTVKAGGTVTVRNDSDQVLDFASDPHPVHTDNLDLNAGVISPGQSKTFTPTRTGEWGIHNHENDSHTGTLTVE